MALNCNSFKVCFFFLDACFLCRLYFCFVAAIAVSETHLIDGNLPGFQEPELFEFVAHDYNTWYIKTNRLGCNKHVFYRDGQHLKLDRQRGDDYHGELFYIQKADDAMHATHRQSVITCYQYMVIILALFLYRYFYFGQSY